MLLPSFEHGKKSHDLIVGSRVRKYYRLPDDSPNQVTIFQEVNRCEAFELSLFAPHWRKYLSVPDQQYVLARNLPNSIRSHLRIARELRDDTHSEIHRESSNEGLRPNAQADSCADR